MLCKVGRPITIRNCQRKMRLMRNVGDYFTHVRLGRSCQVVGQSKRPTINKITKGILFIGTNGFTSRLRHVGGCAAHNSIIRKRERRSRSSGVSIRIKTNSLGSTPAPDNRNKWTTWKLTESRSHPRPSKFHWNNSEKILEPENLITVRDSSRWDLPSSSQNDWYFSHLFLAQKFRNCVRCDLDTTSDVTLEGNQIIAFFFGCRKKAGSVTDRNLANSDKVPIRSDLMASIIGPSYRTPIKRFIRMQMYPNLSHIDILSSRIDSLLVIYQTFRHFWRLQMTFLNITYWKLILLSTAHKNYCLWRNRGSWLICFVTCVVESNWRLLNSIWIFKF
jgi:hypothetical protein